MDYVIHECAHCHERTNGKYCSNCNTKDKRLEMDKTNEAFFKEKNLSFTHYCPDYQFSVKHLHTPTCDKDIHAV